MSRPKKLRRNNVVLKEIKVVGQISDRLPTLRLFFLCQRVFSLKRHKGRLALGALEVLADSS